MPEFALIKRTEVPNAWQVGTHELGGPKARLHRRGCLYFSVQAAAVMGTEDCRVLAEYDEAACTLKFTRMENRLPRGISESDLFPMRIRTPGPNNRRPIGMISILALLKYIGFELTDGPVDFPIVAIDAEARSITLSLKCSSPTSGSSLV